MADTVGAVSAYAKLMDDFIGAAASIQRVQPRPVAVLNES